MGHGGRRGRRDMAKKIGSEGRKIDFSEFVWECPGMVHKAGNDLDEAQKAYFGSYLGIPGHPPTHSEK